MEIKNGYLYFETEKTVETKKKMSGHAFVELSGFNKYQKKGDCVLSLLGLLKNEVDPKYLFRGNVAEAIVRKIASTKYEDIVWYDEEDKQKNHYDFFPEYLQCGGIPDIEIPSKQTLIEVKSKSLAKKQEIISNPPLEEIYQGLFYGYLRNVPKIEMAWVFFDKESETAIFQKQKPKTLSKVETYFKTYEVNREEMKTRISEALKYYNACVKEKRIPLEDISPKILRALKVENFNEEEF